MPEDLLAVLSNSSVEQLFLLISFGSLRALGLSFGLLPLIWALGRTVTLRISIAIAISVPLIVSHGASISDLARSASGMDLAMLGPKEFVVGYALGLVASLPIYALQFAGAITDSYRGEQDSGTPGPDGSPIQTFSILYLVIGTFIFAVNSGLWDLVNVLYQSFAVWPIDQLLPALSQSSVAVVLDILQSILFQAILIASPLFAFLFFTEVTLMVAAKIAPGYALHSHVFLLKNLVTLAVLPVLIVVVWQMAEMNASNGPNPIDFIKALLK